MSGGPMAETLDSVREARELRGEIGARKPRGEWARVKFWILAAWDEILETLPLTAVDLVPFTLKTMIAAGAFWFVMDRVFR